MRVFYANNGESNAVTGPRVHSMVGHWWKEGKIDKKDDNVHTETSGNLTMMISRMVTQDQNHLCEIELSQLKSWKYNKSWTILIVNMMT